MSEENNGQIERILEVQDMEIWGCRQIAKDRSHMTSRCRCIFPLQRGRRKPTPTGNCRGF